MRSPALNCPEAYHIEHLYRSGYGCWRIAEVVGRSRSYMERSLRACPTSPRLAMFVGRLSKGIRPKSDLKPGWTVAINKDYLVGEENEGTDAISGIHLG